MTTEQPKRGNPLNRLSDLLEEHLLHASDEEVEEIAREWGLDPEKAVESVDAAFDSALLSEKRARIEAAKAQRQVEIARLQALEDEFPGNRAHLLSLLEAKLQLLRKDNPSRVTIQHRNLQEMTEDALRSLLKQLSVIGEE